MAQHSLQTLLLIIFHTQNLGDIRFVWIVLLAAIVLSTVFLWSRKFVVSSLQFCLLFSLLIITSLLVSPHTHFHDLSLLLVVAIILLSAFPQMKPKLKKRYVLFLLSGYLIMLFGYLLDLITKTQFSQSWIVISVCYLFMFWLILVRDLFSLQKSDRV